ncbi:MAG: hypothetical protein KKA31_00825, partial [Candidatus Margulisbacteria bacterium]|nr:hypothetical protein [Candidatus Margulisiibacteriota bacterium]
SGLDVELKLDWNTAWDAVWNESPLYFMIGYKKEDLLGPGHQSIEMLKYGLGSKTIAGNFMLQFLHANKNPYTKTRTVVGTMLNYTEPWADAISLMLGYSRLENDAANQKINGFAAYGTIDFINLFTKLAGKKDPYRDAEFDSTDDYETQAGKADLIARNLYQTVDKLIIIDYKLKSGILAYYTKIYGAVFEPQSRLVFFEDTGMPQYIQVVANSKEVDGCDDAVKAGQWVEYDKEGEVVQVLNELPAAVQAIIDAASKEATAATLAAAMTVTAKYADNKPKLGELTQLMNIYKTLFTPGTKVILFQDTQMPQYIQVSSPEWQKYNKKGEFVQVVLGLPDGIINAAPAEKPPEQPPAPVDDAADPDTTESEANLIDQLENVNIDTN